MFASGFSWAQLWAPMLGIDSFLNSLGVSDPTHIVAHSWFVCAMIVAGSLLARVGLEKARAREGIERYFSDDRLSARNMAEIFAEGVLSLLKGMMPASDARWFFPLSAGLFAYIFLSNIIGIFPGFLPPTDNANTNVGMAIIVFLVFNGVGLYRDPVGYLKHLAGPMAVLMPFLFLLETFSLCVRVVSLTLRLTGNMFGDHTVFNVMSDLFGWFLPVPFLALAIFVSFMQAFVFALLSSVYIAMALPHHDGDHH